MDWKLKYNIEFKGLKEGVHEFDFEVNDAFFGHFENSLIEKGDIKAMVTLGKRSSFMSLHFNLSGKVELTCDRCLEPYLQKVSYESDIFVKYGEETDDESDNVIWVLPEEHQLNIAQLLYEFAALSIPMRHVHPKDEYGHRACNPDMIEKLKQLKVNSKTEEPNFDPRWEILKKLNNN